MNINIADTVIKEVLQAFGLEETAKVEPLGSGLINKTWKVLSKKGEFVLQKINESVFKQPADIAYNIRVISDHLKSHSPGYLFPAPLRAIDDKDMVEIKGTGFFRMFHYIPGSHTIDVVEEPGQAYEAARQFGRFTKLLAGFDAENLKTIIPDFHNLALRYSQFLEAVKAAGTERKQQANPLIKSLLANSDIVEVYEAIKLDEQFKLRVTHHDTKISNVLFDKAGKGICVIDPDTIMPGYFISDVGDMIRTYVSPTSEEEQDLSKINIRKEFYEAIVKGYMGEMGDELSEHEKNYVLFAGKFMIYMQALRFLTDYLNNDIYYPVTYPGQNLSRAENQYTLLKKLVEGESNLLRPSHS